MCQYLDITSLPALELPPHFPPRLHDVGPGLKMRAKIFTENVNLSSLCLTSSSAKKHCTTLYIVNIVNLDNI